MVLMDRTRNEYWKEDFSSESHIHSRFYFKPNPKDRTIPMSIIRNRGPVKLNYGSRDNIKKHIN